MYGVSFHLHERLLFKQADDERQVTSKESTIQTTDRHSEHKRAGTVIRPDVSRMRQNGEEHPSRLGRKVYDTGLATIPGPRLIWRGYSLTKLFDGH
jgi:hypothetical protein